MKRVIYISSSSELSVKNEQLIVKNKTTGEETSTPLEDISVVELDFSDITFTNYILTKFFEKNIVVSICNSHHLPIGIGYSLDGNSLQSQRTQYQINVSKTLIKKLWKQIVVSKITNQFLLLKKLSKPFEDLEKIIKKIEDGDETNQEAKASQFYWKLIFSNNFKRERFGEYPNSFLNYGYSIIRATMLRSIVSTGFSPTIGLHHKNQYNPYCLGDDMMEPYRIFVDELTHKIYEEFPVHCELTKEIKSQFLNLLFKEVELDNQTKPLMNCIKNNCEQLLKSFSEEKSFLKFPKV